MIFIITSEIEVCGKFKGDSLTEKELLEAGANIDALIAGNHIKVNATTPTIKPVTQEGAIK